MARQFKNAPAEEEKSKDALEDVWRYIGGWYEIKKSEDKLYFRENNLQGELVAQDDWLVAELAPAGTIRLKLGPSGREVLSNFKPADTDTWGDTITALREWESLTERTDALKGTLSGATLRWHRGWCHRDRGWSSAPRESSDLRGLRGVDGWSQARPIDQGGT